MKRLGNSVLLRCVAALGIAAAEVPAHQFPALAQAPTSTPAASPDYQRLRQGTAAVLLAVRNAALAEAISVENGSSWRGTAASVAFPLPTCTFEGGLCGAINRDGSVAVAPQFDWVDKFHEGRAMVRSGGLYGYVDTAGRVVVEPQYEIAGVYWRGHAEVDVGGKSALIDLAGRQVLEPRFARAHPFTTDVFWVLEGTRQYTGRPGIAELVNYVEFFVTGDVSVDGKWGLIDRTGTWIRRPEFTAIGVFDRNDDGLVRVKADTGWGVIKPDGTWFLEPKFESLGAFADGPTPVRIGGRAGYIDRSGNFLIAPTFDDARYFDQDGLAAASIGKMYGLIDRTGAWVIEPKYEWIAHGLATYKGFIWFREAGKWGAIDRSGQIIARPQFSQSATICNDGWVIGRADGKSVAVRREGAPPLVMPQGELLGTDCERSFQIQRGGKFGYVDRTLKPLTEIKFESATEFFGDAAVVKLDGRFGYINRDGTWLIEPRFDEARSFVSDAAIVRLAGKYGCIKRDGTWLIEPQLAEAPLSCGYLVAKIDGKFGHAKPDGTWLIDPQFEKVVGFAKGFDAVKVGGKFGVIDETTGAWLIEPRWRGFGIALNSGLVAARLADKWGFIDASGALVIDDKYDAFSYFERGVSWVKTGATWCAIDRRGRRVPALECQGSDPKEPPGTASSRIRP